MDDIDALEAERRNLLALAYRMLGTVADAEDAVQETYVRWYRMSEEERAEIINPAAWLTTTAKRRAMDAVRRERVFRTKLPLLVEPEETVDETATASLARRSSPRSSPQPRRSR